jgi:tetratricopeptide (TPR) repeat protein
MLKLSDISDSESYLHWDAQKLASEGKAAFEIGDLECCSILLHRALELDPDNADAHVDLGNLYLDLHKTLKAREECHEAIRLKPSSPRPWQGLGNIEHGLGNTQVAITHYERAIQLDSGFYKAYHALGNCYLDLKNFKFAEEFYLKALKLTSTDYLTIHGLAGFYAAMGDYEKSEVLLDPIESAQLARHYIKPYFDLFSGIEYKLKKYEEAITIAEKLYCLELGKETQYFALSRIACIYYNIKDFQRACDFYEAAVELDSSELNSWTQLLWSLAQTSDKELTLYWAAKAEDAFPEDSVLCFHIAAIYNYFRDTARAIVYMEKAVETDPLCVEAKATLAYFYFLDNRNEEALLLARKVSKKLKQITSPRLCIFIDGLAEYLRFVREAELSAQFLARYKELNA